MNLNTILDILLNQRLGLVEYKIEYLYPEIHKNLLNNTLPIFSQYFPCYRRFSYTPADNKTDVQYEYYLNIPEVKAAGLNIISIADVSVKSGIEGNAFAESYRPLGMTLEDVIINSASSSIASLSNYSYRNFRYIAPNRVKLKGFGETELYVTFKISYPTFSAIPDSIIEQFIDLAEADIKIFIYDKLKHYDQLQLPVGNIDLKLSKFESGVSDRADVINRFNSKGYPNKSTYKNYRYE